MSIYINGISSISPQPTFNTHQFLTEIIEHQSKYIVVEKPNYKEFINPKLLRRMSKIIRMGVATANMAMQEAKIDNPDAIITGTGLGCIVDTEKFLNTMLENKETLLTPTSFILSTHNTVGAQIAVMLGCNNYNYTYVHSAVSFESSLIDAIMHFEDQTAKHILVGGIDELTEENYNTKLNSGIWKNEAIKISDLYKHKSEGCIPGESSTFTVLSSQKTESTYAELVDVHTVFEANDEEIDKELYYFLERNHLSTEDIDVVLLGINGDADYDQSYLDFAHRHFSNQHLLSYKNICGEHDSASAFAFWTASKMLKHQHVPEIVEYKKGKSQNLENVLIYHYNFMHRNNHAFTLLKR